MCRKLVFVFAGLWSLAESSSAEILTITDLPPNYTPGSTFTFNVVLTGAVDLASYNIELLLTGNGGNPGVDFAFNPIPTAPTSNYVFPSSDNFFAAVNLTGVEHRLTLSDFTATGVDTVPGVNNLVALVSVQVSPGFVGQLQLAFDARSLFLDNSAGSPINGFDELSDYLASAPPHVISSQPTIAVPAPASMWLAIWGIAVSGFWRAQIWRNLGRMVRRVGDRVNHCLTSTKKGRILPNT